MRVFLIISLLLLTWAVTSVVAQDTSFVPRGINRAVNVHSAPIGTAEKCVDFMFDNGVMTKRDGYQFLVRITDRDWTGVWTYIDDNKDKRLIGCAQNTANNYQSLYASPVYSYTIGNTSLQDYIYLDETATAVVYNGVFILANGKNRPYRYNGTDFQPLVEVPPGSFDFAPEKPSDNTDSTLDGRYFYGWQVALPDSIKGDSIFYSYPDSMNLSGPSWEIEVDSGWIRVFSVPFTGPTAFASIPESTIVRLCRTRAGKLWSDSMFLIDTLNYDTSDYDFSFVDSIPDDSLGVDPKHPFVGFIDTVAHTVSSIASAQMDSTYQIGQPQLLSIDSLNYHTGISADDASLGNVVDRRWIFMWYDSSTGMMTAPGPYLRVPADSVDSIVNIITPMFDTTESYWGILARAEEILDSASADTLDPSALSDNGWTIRFVSSRYIGYEPKGLWWQAGRCRTVDEEVWDEVAGRLAYCQANRITISPDEYSVSPYYPVCTVKSVVGFCDTIADSFSVSVTNKAGAININETIGQWDNVCVLQDRVLMSEGSIVHYNGWTGRSSEIAYWPIGNAFAVGADDNDEVTALHAGDKYVDIFKNYSWYRARETGVNEYAVFEIINNIGCIATNSIQDMPGGGLAFESRDGIYVFGSHWQSPYKTSGGNINRISDPVWLHLSNWAMSDREHCYSWLTSDKRNMIFSYPLLDTSLVVSLTDNQWSQWSFAPRMTTEYDLSPYIYGGLIPESGLVFIEYDSDSLFRFGRVKTDIGDTFQGVWKSLESFQTDRYGRITEFSVWKYSNSANGLDFNIYDVVDTGIVETVRDTLGERVRPMDINPLLSRAFKIEIKSYADSLAIDRVDVKYQPVSQPTIH
jgi:hypothetical protein